MTKEFADVAQLVEQLIRNQQVNGSSPFVGSIISITFGSADCQLLTTAVQAIFPSKTRIASCALRGAVLM
jgi:hypothetical protein